MKSHFKPMWLSVCFCMTASLLVAQKPMPKDPHEKYEPFKEQTIRQGNMVISKLTNKPIAMYNVNFQAISGDPSSMALQYLNVNKATLGLTQAEVSDLSYYASRQTLTGYVVRYRQTYKGVPVGNNEITININTKNQVDVVFSNYRSLIRGISTTPQINMSQAIVNAEQYLGTPAAPVSRSRLMIFQVPGVSDKLAYEINLIPDKPVGDWKITVDANTGEILEARDIACYGPVNGSGNIFDPDPLSSAHVAYGTGGYKDNANANNSDLTSQLKSVTLTGIDLTGGVYTLKGSYAAITDFESPFDGTFTQGSSSFAYNRSQASFDAVMGYYFIDMSMRYINSTLSISLSPTQYAGGVQYDPHGLSGADNSHYLPSSGQLAYGQGGVDDAQDADVILHELGHGIHDWITSGNLSQVEGLSEGCGDYWAQSYSRSLNQWTLDDAARQWVFSWDGHNEFWSGRITNYTATYPGGLIGDIHTDGQIWSTAMMKIFDAIGRSKTDVIFLTGLSNTTSTSSQENAAQMVYKAAKDLSYPVGDLCIIWNIFTNTGYDLSPVGPAPTSTVVDYYMQDTPADFGIEPNPDTGPMWISQDIWNRQTNDGLLTNQNPEYKTLSPNYIYVRVRGRSCATSTKGKLHVYWSKASTGLNWSTNWISFYGTTHVGTILFGDEVTASPVNIPAIPAGGEWITAIPWYPPNPADYDDDIHHFCLLARIVNTDDPMHTIEGTSVYTNVKNNNNIAWKNEEIYDINPGDKHWVYVRNLSNATATMRLNFSPATDQPYNPNFYDMGTMTVTLDDNLYQEWVAGGNVGNNIEDAGNGTLQITGPGAYIGNITMAGDETRDIGVAFTDNSAVADHDFVVDVTQSSDNNETIEGGERFYMTYNTNDGTQGKTSLKKPVAEDVHVNVYPNPFVNTLSAEVDLNQDQRIQMRLTTLTGVLVSEQSYTLKSGKNTLNLEFTKNIAQGVYILQTKDAKGRTYIQRIEKLDK